MRTPDDIGAIEVLPFVSPDSRQAPRRYSAGFTITNPLQAADFAHAAAESAAQQHA